VKRNAIINTIIGVLWIIGGVVAMSDNASLALFGIIPIPSILVIVIGLVWTVLGIMALVRKPAQAPAPVPAPQQYYPADQQQYYPAQQPYQQPMDQQYPEMPRYAPRDTDGPTPI